MEYGDSFQSHEHQLPIILWVRIDGLNELDDCLPQAKHNLGVMYEYGRGVAQDHKEAVKWDMGPGRCPPLMTQRLPPAQSAQREGRQLKSPHKLRILKQQRDLNFYQKKNKFSKL